MKIIALQVLSSCTMVASFASSSFNARRISTNLHMASEETPKKKPLSAADILARARASVGVPKEEEAPVLFTEGILDDMQSSLLTLDKRVKEGPGSLAAWEVKELEAAMTRVFDEMDDFTAKNGNGSPANPPPQLGSGGKGPVQRQAPPPPQQAAPVQQAPSQGGTAMQTKAEAAVEDLSEDEGPAYDGKSGMGLARGTRNTYVIPGMDEMSPEEYRTALQRTISGRQERRRENREGIVGNRAALQYLDQLGWGSGSGNWKSNEEDD